MLVLQTGLFIVISMQICWPEGAKDGELITTSHDSWWIDQLAAAP